MSIRVVADEGRGRDGMAQARRSGADLVVIGDHVDLSQAETVREANTLPHAPLVLALLGQPDAEGLGAILAAGAAGVLIRSADADEVSDAVRRISAGERVVSPALAHLLAGAVRAAAEPAPRKGDATLLTTKEREVLSALAAGHTNREIAAELVVSGATVKTHLAHIYAKLGVTDRRSALARAVELGLLG